MEIRDPSTGQAMTVEKDSVTNDGFAWVKVKNSSTEKLSVLSQSEENNDLIAGHGFVMPIASVTPTGAGDYFAYLENPSGGAGHSMKVQKIQLTKDAGEIVTVELAEAGTPSGGGSVTVSNRKAGAALPEALVGYKGADVGGLSSGTEVDALQAGEETLEEEFVIPPGYAVQLKATTGTTAITGRIIGILV